MEKLTVSGEIRLSNGYVIKAEVTEKGGVWLSTDNPGISQYGDKWHLGTMTFDEDGKFLGKKF
jgi:ligand-binding sensor domain-containing protein